jgi:hypothetical protein
MGEWSVWHPGEAAGRKNGRKVPVGDRESQRGGSPADLVPMLGGSLRSRGEGVFGQKVVPGPDTAEQPIDPLATLSHRSMDHGDAERRDVLPRGSTLEFLEKIPPSSTAFSSEVTAGSAGIALSLRSG